MKKTILEEAQSIVHDRSEDAERKHGPMHKCVVSTATIATEMSGKLFTPDDVYNMLIALKVARMRFGPQHRDHYVDACGYLSAKFENHGKTV